MARIDEIRERLDKARPGMAEIDGGGDIQKRRGNPKGSYTWTLYGTYADAILLVNARNDLAWLLDYINDRDALIERLAARVAWYEPRYHARTMALIKIRGLARQAGLPEIQGLANEALTTTNDTKEN